MDRKNGKLNFRELAGFVLLTALLLTGLLLAWYTGRQNTAVCRLLDDSAWLALSGQWEKARDTASIARERWQTHRNLRAAFLHQAPMEQIDVLFGQLMVYAAAGERTDFAQTCAALARQMEAMASSGQLRWWNVL